MASDNSTARVPTTDSFQLTDEQVAHLRPYGAIFKIQRENISRTLVISLIPIEIGVIVETSAHAAYVEAHSALSA